MWVQHWGLASGKPLSFSGLWVPWRETRFWWCSVRRAWGKAGGTPGTLRIAAEGEVGPSQGYLLNNQDSTVQGSGWGQGKSPHSPSSCSLQNHLPKGRRDFTKTWDSRAASPHQQKGNAPHCLWLALKDARMRLGKVDPPPPLLPHVNEDQLLSTGDRNFRKVLPVSRQGSQSWDFVLSASYPTLQQQLRPYHHPLHILLSISLEPWLTPNL